MAKCLWHVSFAAFLIASNVLVSAERPRHGKSQTPTTMLAAGSAHPAYTIIELGITSTDESEAYAINSQGQVVGQSGPFAFFFDGKATHALPTLGGDGAFAFGINTAGDIVGTSPLAGNEGSHAFLYKAGRLIDLGANGGRECIAYAINDSDAIAGVFYTDEIINGASFGGVPHAFVYTPDGGMQRLSIPTPSLVESINRFGEIVGTRTPNVDPSMGGRRAFVYTSKGWYDLSDFGFGADARGINDAASVVGYADSGSATHAFVYRNGVMSDISPSAGNSEAVKINSFGQVVGYFTDGIGASHAFIHSNHTTCDLNDLLPAGSGWWLIEANAINDAGQIVGGGYFGGRLRAFLLTPVKNAQAGQRCLAPDGGRLVRVTVSGKTRINLANHASEETVIDAEVIFPPGTTQAGQRDTAFTGPITFSEEAGTSDYDGQDGASALPVTVNAAKGVASVALQSLSVSANGTPPTSALIRADCDSCMSDLQYPRAVVAQWIDNDGDGLIDWLEAASNDLLRRMKQTGGEVSAIARTVSRVEPTDQNDPRLAAACGYFDPPTSVLHVSPNCGGDPRAHRRNYDAELSETILHESRHAWQFSQVQNPHVDIDADGLRNQPAQFPTPNDPAGEVTAPPAGWNYIEERTATILGGSGRDNFDDRQLLPVNCKIAVNHNDVVSCAWESDAYSFGRHYKRLFP